MQGNKCPSCGSPLLFQANLGAQANSDESESHAWQQTPWGRMVAGLLLAQGLAHGLAMFWTAGHLAGGDEPRAAFWSSESGFLLWQALQGVGLLLGGALCGAGKNRGFVYASFVGLISGLFSLVTLQGRAEGLEPIFVYGQPVLHMVCAAVGGFIATRIWRPLPFLRVPAPLQIRPQKDVVPRVVNSEPIPISWVRVAIGVAIVVYGVLAARNILLFIVNMSDGRFSIQSSYQMKILTWEVMALVTLVGAGFAGANTRSGFKHGFIVAIGACILTAGINLGRSQFVFDSMVVVLAGVWILSVVGGWFGGMLFPPACAVRRKGVFGD